MKPALAIILGSAAVRESYLLAEPLILADSRMPENILSKIRKKYHNFFEWSSAVFEYPKSVYPR